MRIPLVSPKGWIWVRGGEVAKASECLIPNFP